MNERREISPNERTIRDTVIHLNDIDETSRYLLEVLDKTLSSEGEDPEQLERARQEIRKTIESFPKVIPELLAALKAKLQASGVETGTGSVYMVGGRVRGTPIKANSDIDLRFAFQRPPSPMLNKDRGEIDVPSWIRLKKTVLRQDFIEICERNGITVLTTPQGEKYPGRFQIMDWGQKTPEDLEIEYTEPSDAILLFRDDQIETSNQ